MVYWSRFENPYTRSDAVQRSSLEPLLRLLWLDHYKFPIDTIDRYWDNCLAKIRVKFFKADWHEVYSFVEFVAEHGGVESGVLFRDACNEYLERENSAYRFVDNLLTEITSAEEIEEVERAIQASSPYGGARVHLSTALQLLSDRVQPDYRNSIKESISAVEALAKHVSGEKAGTLGGILKSLERSHGLHPSLKSAFSALYGYTSDAEGIRHALMEQTGLAKADARLMLVCCSAFVNYVIDVLESRSS